MPTEVISVIELYEGRLNSPYVSVLGNGGARGEYVVLPSPYMEISVEEESGVLITAIFVPS